MYREPHLQRKSDECAEIWNQWYEWRYTRPEDPLAPSVARELRSQWGQCAIELGDMVQETLRTDPYYKGWEKLVRVDKKPKPR